MSALVIKTGFVRIDTAVLAVKEIRVNDNSNDQPALIFLHEGLGSIDQWKDFPELLAETTGLNAYVYDRQGYGMSAPFERKRDKFYMHMEAHEVLPELFRKLKLSKPVLIGHSDGATIALLYASRFNPLAIICEAAHIFVEEKALKGIRQAVDLRKGLLKRLEKYHGGKTEAMFDAWANTWLSERFSDWDISDELKSIKCPTLILQGENDEYATPEHPQIIKQSIGENAESILVESCGHSPHLARKEDIIKILVNFIGSFNN